jgi:hypothetical protein
MREIRRLALGLLLVAPVLAVACSSSTADVPASADAAAPSSGDSSTTPPADQSSPPPADAAPDVQAEAAADAAVADAAAACDMTTVDGPTVTSTVESGTAPTMTGGTIVDGKYWRTAQARYGGSMGVTMVAERLDISGGGSVADDGTHEMPVDHRGGFTLTTSGTSLMIHGICGEFTGLDVTETYTATATTFVTLTSAGRLTTYTKQ